MADQDMLEFINPPGPSIPGISAAVAVRSGQPVFFSGHVPVTVDGSLELGSLERQLEAAFANLERSMAAAGVAREQVARLTLYVRDYRPEELALIRAVRDRHIAGDHPPASALIGVSHLFAAGVRVEIDAVAVRP